MMERNLRQVNQICLRYINPDDNHIPLNLIRPDLTEYIQKCQAELKRFLENQTMNLFEGTKKDGPTPLDKIYTELYITKGGSGEVNTEHEVNELECKRRPSEEAKIYLNDIFQPLPNEGYPPRRVLTEGIAGIGKTVSVLKFTQNWAREEANHTAQFLFPFTFRELNLIKDESWSLMTLIAHYFVEVKDLKASDYDDLTVLFIFDGLDESQLSLDFTKVCRSVTEPTTIDVLLSNLITGKLMHKASVWITSRPAASARIPYDCIDRRTEVRGFNDKQKEEYFQKKVSDRDMAQKIIEHLQSKPLRSLYIMCHIPVFCWISATVFQSLLTETHRGELPKTLTEMYTHFLIVQTNMTHKKNYQKREADKVLIMKLGKLAFEQLQKGNMIFDQNHLKSCQIDLTHAAVYSGVCTQIIKKERGLHQKEMYCFIHLSVQEFLAALYVLETFIDSGENVLQTGVRRNRKLTFLHKKAVDMALESKNGQWDLFLRFLLGLSQDENQKLIQEVFGFKKGCPTSNEETIKHIHEKIEKLSYADQSINLFHCLNELGDQSLVQQVQNYQSSGDVSEMPPAHWSALAYLLLVTNDDLDVFDLKKYCKSHDVLQRLLPVLKVSKIALLSDCKLAGRCCKFISEVLKHKSCCLEELDLSRNKLEDHGMRLLSDGLKSPNCKLQKLTLADCQFSEVGCGYLASSLKSNPDHLRVLDLAKNKLQDAGVDRLSELLAEPLCKLEKLSLKCCSLTADSCSRLAQCCPSSLKELDLSYNQQTDRGVGLLCDWLGKPQCCLEILRLSEVTDSGCESLASAMTLNPSHLRELHLSKTDPEGSGALHLSQIQSDSYQLQALTVTVTLT